MLILVGRFVEGIAESNIVILNKQGKFSVLSIVAIEIAFFYLSKFPFLMFKNRIEYSYFRGRVQNTNQSEARIQSFKQSFLASDRLKFGTLPKNTVFF